MFVLRKTMEAAVEAQREIGSRAVRQLAESYGDALHRVSGLQRQLSAWVMNEPGNITPKQMAQMFYAQDDSWQAAFFNSLQTEIAAIHDAMPPSRPGAWSKPSAGVPAGEGQWYHMAKLLTDDGFETIQAMWDHAQYHRKRNLESGEVATQHAVNVRTAGSNPASPANDFPGSDTGLYGP